ncbi:hypothetical protein SARC_01473 [Sphaeroforma arctica JP610]|uniref:Uncharacterized protein n=1 Tax=Sphaeroforma arctica JP610 TaxID=667725 RepID=A0A0L0GDN9_9EUKA|nr:hypothetical protein SARC_01473 [Sphaeroforma arctica JP610]KNC86378.1 hypothetical protein SARC_01473 [Sphaeroforma arctica JP610]|eukprot:XP_014160280.1 hypothetical protein SARC_01473 [Sphaeroforma arctica JP610]
MSTTATPGPSIPTANTAANPITMTQADVQNFMQLIHQQNTSIEQLKGTVSTLSRHGNGMMTPRTVGGTSTILATLAQSLPGALETKAIKGKLPPHE